METITINNEVIIAGAGSGKTHCLTHKILDFIKSGIPPESIVAISYTNKAASELHERLETHLDKEVVNKIQLGTFHSLALLWLRKITKSNLIPIDGEESKDILKLFTIHNNAYLRVYNKFMETQYQVDLQILIQGEIVDIDYNDIQKVFQQYFEFKKKHNLIDFPQLIRNLYEALRLEKFNTLLTKDINIILVDEAQDINLMQYELLLLMKKKIIMCGDDWQSIYSFRGGSQEFMKKFTQHPDTITTILPFNYRSAPEIVEFCLNIMNNTTKTNNFISKTQTAVKTTVGKITIQQSKCIPDYIEQLFKNNEEQYAILGKDNNELNKIASELETKKIPYYFDCRQPNFDLLEKKRYVKYIQNILEGKDFYKAIINKNIDYTELIRIHNEVKSEISSAEFLREKIKELVNTILVNNKAEYNEEEDTAKEYNNERIILSTIHSAKGLEWKNVILIGIESSKYDKSGTENDEENRRLLYVACSRARENLYILYKTKLSAFILPTDTKIEVSKTDAIVS